MNIYIIIGLAVTVLAIIGTTQRQHLKTWFRSEAKDFIDKNTNTLKVAKLKLSDLKVKQKEIVEQAGEVFALEELQKKQLESLEKQHAELLTDAKTAKESDNKTKAIEYLKLVKETAKQVELTKENIETLSKRRTSLELNLQKIKTYIATNDIRLKGLSSRKSVNTLLKDIKVGAINEDTLEETIDSTEEDIVKDELILDYITEDSLEEESNVELDKDYEDL